MKRKNILSMFIVIITIIAFTVNAYASTEQNTKINFLLKPKTYQPIQVLIQEKILKLFLLLLTQ